MPSSHSFDTDRPCREANMPSTTTQPDDVQVPPQRARAKSSTDTTCRSEDAPSSSTSPKGDDRYKDLFIPRYNNHYGAFPPPPLLSLEGSCKPHFAEPNAMAQWLSACRWDDNALESHRPIQLPWSLGRSGVDRDGKMYPKTSVWSYESPELPRWQEALHGRAPAGPWRPHSNGSPKIKSTLSDYTAHRAQRADSQLNSPAVTGSIAANEEARPTSGQNGLEPE